MLIIKGFFEVGKGVIILLIDKDLIVENEDNVYNFLDLNRFGKYFDK